MTNYSVLIVDDEKENISLLEIYINKYCSNLIKKVFSATSSEEFINSYLENHQDILILDIELGSNIKSFSIVQTIPNMKAEIIFVTSHKSYAIEVINKTQVTAYLLKPIKPIDLIIALDKAMTNLKNKDTDNYVIDIKNNQNKSKFIAISSSNEIEVIHTKDIIYLEADGRYTIFHLCDKSKKTASRNLGEYEKQLCEKLFFRIHHKYIINLSMVYKINKSAGNYCEMKNGVSLPIARRRLDELHKFLKIK